MKWALYWVIFLFLFPSSIKIHEIEYYLYISISVIVQMHIMKIHGYIPISQCILSSMLHKKLLQTKLSKSYPLHICQLPWDKNVGINNYVFCTGFYSTGGNLDVAETSISQKVCRSVLVSFCQFDTN